jgi:hypothetical protein
MLLKALSRSFRLWLIVEQLEKTAAALKERGKSQLHKSQGAPPIKEGMR